MARPKGAKNKVGSDAKDNILAVFTRLGGTAAMADWAKENLTEFYRIYARLIPQQIHADVAHTVVRTINEGELVEALGKSLGDASRPTVQ